MVTPVRPPAAKVSDVDKRFGGAHALRGVSITFETGDVHAVAGENGAGKSTLMKILSGVISDYDGTVEVDGTVCRFSSIREAEHHGVFLVPQELNIVPELRVGEYLFLNREPQRWGLVNVKKLWADAANWLDVFKLHVSPVAHMGDLSTHEQQLVSIARAITKGVKVLILDEPTASLTERETELLFERIADLHRHDVTTIYISHRLHEFERIANVVTVMRDGSVVDHFRLEGGRDTPRRVIRAMVGRDLTEMYPKVAAPSGDPVLELRGFTLANPAPNRPPVVRNVDLTIRAGEVVGLFGLLGSGRGALGRSIFGAHNGAVTGEMKIKGAPARIGNPREAIKHGIAYIPAERKRDGLVTAHSIESNMALAALARFSRNGFIDRKTELQSMQRYAATLRVKCHSIEQPIRELSGGNQQKVVAAKWLLTEHEIFVLEEPTRGVDVNARIELYELINTLTSAGKAILLVSTDLPEILGMADRILMMWEGQIVREWKRGEVSEEEVMIHAAGEHEVAA
jgi:D-xylose transport system ATP-binding protein